jgi:hypothetical protein
VRDLEAAQRLIRAMPCSSIEHAQAWSVQAADASWNLAQLSLPSTSSATLVWVVSCPELQVKLGGVFDVSPERRLFVVERSVVEI